MDCVQRQIKETGQIPLWEVDYWQGHWVQHLHSEKFVTTLSHFMWLPQFATVKQETD